jgi:type VI secretion system VgrG family protein
MTQRPFMFSVSWFDSDAGKNADELYVTSFSGTEEIARPYAIELNLISRSAPQEFRNILKRRCQLSIRRQVASADRQVVSTDQRVVSSEVESVRHTQRQIHGMLSNFELRGFDGTSYQYRTVLVPRLWRATQPVLSRVFVDTSLWDVLQASWSDMPGVDVPTEHDRISNQNPTRKFTMQYRESSLNFLSRWLEFYGISYYFKQEEDLETAVFTNVKEGFLPLATGDDNKVQFVAEARGLADREVLRSVFWRNILVPKTLTMADYNIDEPTRPKRAVVDVSTPGTGDHVQIDSDTTTFDVEDVLDVRKDEYLGAAYRIFGVSNVRALSAGYTFKIKENPVDAAETEYLLVRLTHRGEQTVDIDSGQASGASYENSYEAIPHSITYRPPSVTPRPQVAGFVHGVVENPDGAQYPGIDDNGYYRVRLFFDNDSALNNASCPIRKMEPYGGPDRGMHMPLINGTEVVVGFLGADPDQPFIAGALPGPSQPSPVASSNRDRTIIQTKSTKIVMQDLEGEESITLSNSGTFAGQNLSVLTDASFAVGNSTKSLASIASMAAMQTDISLVSKVIQGLVAVSIASMRGITIMAGYKKIQAAIAALMVGLSIGYKYESEAKRTGNQPAAVANIIMPILNLVLTLVIVQVQLKLLKRAIAQGMKLKLSPRSVVCPDREKRMLLSSNALGVMAGKVGTFFATLFTMRSFTEAYSKSKALPDGVDEADIHGLTLVRAGDGNALGVQGEGKSILIATDGGSIDMIAEKDFTVFGNQIMQTAETSAMIVAMGKPGKEIGSAMSVDMNSAALMGPGDLPPGTIRVGKDWLAIGHNVHGAYSTTKHGTGFMIQDNELLATSKHIAMGTGNGKVAVGISEDYGVLLMGNVDGGVVLSTMGAKVVINNQGIVIEEKAGKGIKIQSVGEIKLSSNKGITLSAGKVAIKGGNVTLDGISVKINGQGVGAIGGSPPPPPVIKPPMPVPPPPPVVPTPPAITAALLGASDKAAMTRMSAVMKWFKSIAALAAKK